MYSKPTMDGGLEACTSTGHAFKFLNLLLKCSTKRCSIYNNSIFKACSISSSLFFLLDLKVKDT